MGRRTEDLVTIHLPPPPSITRDRVKKQKTASMDPLVTARAKFIAQCARLRMSFITKAMGDDEET